ncbi:sugar phosphate isomerase/epimerase [Plantactinospora mayteni]|uniref:Xylose isomerase n=1 Tax=Plantactinospora mayteni TaxID=566021 RepID=A0ABQ4EII6_9ACTN|nr:TIM barrel protein [Plantactinospora mayteni]GIG94530.1 xylose isomerase [Plantactinospora mayteni]
MLGINLCFAVKRYLEPHAWARFVREDLGLSVVQFTFDLADPWWPADDRARIVEQVRKAADDWQLTIHSAFVGLAHYVPAGLLDPDPDARRLAITWWTRAAFMAGELGATAVGGPLGTMSVRDAADFVHREQRYRDLLDALDVIGGQVRQAGLDHLLIEPTPIAREIPHNVAQCKQLAADLHERGVPFGFAVDTGHTVYEPLYGPNANVGDWLDALASDTKLIHLDNTDRQGDPHWGWPHERGRFDVADFAARLDVAGLADIPVMLEIYPRFEDDDDQVRATLLSSVAHCTPYIPA